MHAHAKGPTGRDPINAAAKPPRKTRGVASAEMIVSGMSTTIPKRSNSLPNASDPVPLTAMATD
jgi:hypothetical protein